MAPDQGDAATLRALDAVTAVTADWAAQRMRLPEVYRCCCPACSVCHLTLATLPFNPSG